MTTYELIIIINPQVSDTEATEIVEKTKKIITDEKAEILNEDRLGRKKFAHQLGRHRDGFYLYLKVKAAPETVKNIARNLKLQESILRAMVLKTGVEPVKKA
ncbi:MAG: 30S ribosomal protein S6 [Elusimicrobia bacterium]|nr:30S ribosomal protein S6 [Elusimicrobiota bacterium]